MTEIGKFTLGAVILAYLAAIGIQYSTDQEYPKKLECLESGKRMVHPAWAGRAWECK